MTDMLTVSSRERGESRLRLGAATLPTLFTYTGGAADVAGILGDDWVSDAIAAIEGGARGVLIVDPSSADVEPLRDVASQYAAAVVLDIGWASSPSVALAASELARLAVPNALVESRIHVAPGADLTFTLVRQVAFLRSAVGPLDELRLVRIDARGYDAVGEVRGGAGVSLSATVSNALPEAAEVRIVRPESAVSLRLGPIDIASPGTIRVLTDEGENHLLAPYETPHREAWRRLHRVVIDGGGADELGMFAEDSELVSHAIERGAVAAI